MPPDPSTLPAPSAGRPDAPPVAASAGPRWSPRDRGNALRVVAGDSFWGFQGLGLIGQPVLAVLLAQLGAGAALIGLVPALEGAAAALQFVGVLLLRSRRRLKAHLVLWHVALVVPFYLAMGALLWFSPRLSPALVGWGLLACYGASMLSIGMIMASWTDWIGHLFNERIRGTAFGGAVAGAALAGTAGALLAAWILPPPATRTPRDFAAHYVLGALSGWASMAIYARVKDPAGELETDTVRRESAAQILGQALASLRDRRFRGFLIARGLAIAGFAYTLVPFIAQHYNAMPGLDSRTVVACSAAAPFAMAVALLAAGYAGDRRGHRVGHLAGVALQIAAVLVVMLGDGPAACSLAFLAAGAAFGCGMVSSFNLLLETCPHGARAVHVGVGNLVLAVPSIVSPVLAGLATQRWGTGPLLAACLTLSAAALAWSLGRMAEPRAR